MAFASFGARQRAAASFSRTFSHGRLVGSESHLMILRCQTKERALFLSYAFKKGRARILMVMNVPTFPPYAEELTLDGISSREDGVLHVLAHASAPTSVCPSCGQTSTHLHSRYRRRLADLPVQGTRVECRVVVRRFHCRTIGCKHRIFTERLPQTLRPYARETRRRRRILEHVAYALGGRPAERMSHVLSMPCSDTTLLRRIRRAPPEDVGDCKVIGIDDFAFKKGQTYGTILVDHHSGRPIELLPDREAQTVEKWLREHPSIEVVSRDRSGSYKVGIDAGAPQAVQVADRFHLLMNVREALQRIVECKNVPLSQAIKIFAAADNAAACIASHRHRFLSRRLPSSADLGEIKLFPQADVSVDINSTAKSCACVNKESRSAEYHAYCVFLE
ncbi:MAG: ISL3 family transposase [Verrucomicrobia bacterium]|nr:ISL3 family transposase [Verrucomicrobiota bacterium]